MAQGGSVRGKGGPGGFLLPFDLYQKDVPASSGVAVPGGPAPLDRDLQPDLDSPEDEDNLDSLQRRFYQNFKAVNYGGQDLNIEQIFKQILYYSEVGFLLNTLGLSNLPRIITVGTTPVEIIPRSRYPRAYLILNPGEITGTTSLFTFYASATRVSPFSTASSALTLTNAETMRFWLDITATTGAAAMEVDVETQSPLTGTWAISQHDIFNGANTDGTYYANIGTHGVDRNIRIRATIGDAGDDITFSIDGQTKGGVLTPVGTTVYIGPEDVNVTMGFPILTGNRLGFFLLENSVLFAISSIDTLNLKVFQLG